MSQQPDTRAQWAHANEEAFLALSGARADVVKPLAKLLRSDAPLEPRLREALADAFEGNRPTGCPIFNIINLGRGPATPAGLARFRLHIAVAEDVERRIEAGALRQDAEQQAASEFAVSEDLCHKAVTGYRKMVAWLIDNADEAPEGYPANLWRKVREASYLFTIGPLVR